MNTACSCNFSFTPGHLAYWCIMAILKHNRQITEILTHHVRISLILVALRLLECYDHGFKSLWRHRRVSLVFVVCCIRSGLCDELITCSEESYQVCVCVCVCVCACVCNFVWSQNLNDKVAWARRGMQHHRKKSEFLPILLILEVS